MVTGEETLEVPGAVCQSCTVEMLNDHEYFDIVVVDECQMIADPYRGHNWTRAVLGLRAEEIHLCMAPEAEDIVVQMIKRCGDQYRVVRHKRNTRLTMEKKPYNLKQDLKKGRCPHCVFQKISAGPGSPPGERGNPLQRYLRKPASRHQA